MAVKTTKEQFNQKATFMNGADFDGEKPVEFGGDVEIDGNLTINSASNLSTKDGTTFSQTFFRHTIRMYEIKGDNETASVFFTAYSKSNLVIDSWQDLLSFFGNTDFAVNGCLGTGSRGEIYYADLPSFIHIGTTIADTIVYNLMGTQSGTGAMFVTIEDSVTAV